MPCSTSLVKSPPFQGGVTSSNLVHGTNNKNKLEHKMKDDTIAKVEIYIASIWFITIVVVSLIETFTR